MPKNKQWLKEDDEIDAKMEFDPVISAKKFPVDITVGNEDHVEHSVQPKNVDQN